MTESSQTSSMTSVGDALVGREIDGCTMVKKIGQGGMGIVYLAEHMKLKQQYVVKILNPAFVAAEDTVQRFFREAQSVARLNHPSIVSIQNVGQEGDYYYIRMEYVDGDTVENIVLKHFFYTPESPKIYTPDLPEAACEIIRRCLKKKKKERYQSAAELARDLRIALGQEAGNISNLDLQPAYRDDDDASGSVK